jgi:hypothetical protein
MTLCSSEDPDSSYKSDSESVCEDGYLTDATDVSTSRSVGNGDATRIADLLADNEHPPEYYIEQWQNGDETEYLKQDYSPGTTVLLDRIEEQWLSA